MKNKEKKELASFLPIVWLNFRQYGGDVFAWREGERGRSCSALSF